jgi:hypothetical protein
MGRQGLVEPAQVRQRHAAIAQGVDEAGRGRQGPVIGRQGLGRTSQAAQGHAPGVQHHRIVRIGRQGRIAGRQRFVIAAQRHQGRRPGRQHAGAHRIQRQGSVQGDQGRRRLAQGQTRRAQHVPGLDGAGIVATTRSHRAAASAMRPAR